MSYTFKPEEKHANAKSTLFISPKDSLILCRAIRKKKLTTAKRLLEDLVSSRRSLGGKYYSKAASQILRIINSCEKNAENLGLDSGRLFVYASASYGPNMRRRRRRSDFGHNLKVTNMEIILVEKGKEKAQEGSTRREKKEAPKAKEAPATIAKEEKKAEPAEKPVKSVAKTAKSE